MEAKAGHICQGAFRNTLVFGSDGVGTVYDKDQSVLFADGADPVVINGLSGEVHRHNSLGPVCDMGLDAIGIDIVGLGIDVCKNRLRSHIYCAIG